MFDIIEQFNGYIIRKTVPETGKKWYLKSVRNGDYTWVSDYLYAHNMTLETARKHRVNLCLADEISFQLCLSTVVIIRFAMLYYMVLKSTKPVQKTH